MGYCMFLKIIFWISALVTYVSAAREPMPADTVANYRCDYNYFPQIDGWLKVHFENTRLKFAKETCKREGAVLWSPTTPLLKMAGQYLLEYYRRDHPTSAVLVDIPLQISPEIKNKEETEHITVREDYDDDYEEMTTTPKIPKKEETIQEKLSRRLPYLCPEKGSSVDEENLACGGYDQEYVFYRDLATCFKYHRVRHTWDEADMMCRSEGGHLAVINYDAEARALQDLFIKHPPRHVPGHNGRNTIYIGVRRRDHSTVWETVHGDDITVRGHWNEWANDMPNKKDGNCVSIDRNVELEQENCSIELPFICERDIIHNSTVYCEYRKINELVHKKEIQTYMYDDGAFGNTDSHNLPFICHKPGGTTNTHKENTECGGYDPEYHLNRNVGRCYKFHKVRDTWDDAKYMCQAEGGHLLIINDYKEAQIVESIFYSNPPRNLPEFDGRETVFIGTKMADVHNYSIWETIDGENITVAGWAEWAHGMPHKNYGIETCGSVDRNGLLQQDVCKRKLPFICERDIIRFGELDLCEETESILEGIRAHHHASTFRCDYKYIPLVEAWFKVNSIPSNWKDAQETCNNEGTSLMKPSSGLMMSMIQLMTKDTNLTTVVVDMNEKTAITTEENIMYVSNMSFDSVQSNAKHPFICQIDAGDVMFYNEDCGVFDSEYQYDKENNRCYKYHNTRRSWQDARDVCKSEHGDLLVINSDQEAEVIKDVYSNYYVSPDDSSLWNNWAYAGYHSYMENQARKWVTIKNETLNAAGYEKWLAREPKLKSDESHCGVVSRNASLKVVPCNVKMTFFCEKEHNETAAATNKISSCEDLHQSLKFDDYIYRSRFRCDYLYFARIGGWLKLHVKRTTHALAKKTCSFEGAELVSPYSDGLKSAIHDLMANAERVFGVHVDKWDYSLNQKRGVQYILRLDGAFSRTTPTHLHSFVCHKRASQIHEFNKECRIFNDDYSWDNRTDHCYKFHFESTTWMEGRAICQAEGGDLAVINSDSEAKAMKDIFKLVTPKLVTGNFKNYAFLGFKVNGSTIQVLDTSVNQPSYKTWAQGEPNNEAGNEHCGGIDREARLYDLPCTRIMPFICERRVDYIMRLCDDWQNQYKDPSRNWFD